MKLYKPTQKAKTIDDFLSSIGFDRLSAILDSVCVDCGKSIDGFRDELSEKEYEISGLCQSCQDSIFS